MKRTAKIVSVVLIVMLVFAFAACKKEQNTVSKDDYIGKPFDKDFDMAVKIDGKAYPVRVDSSEVLKALGDDYEMDQVVSCVYDGYDKTFTYKGIVVSTVPDGDKDIIEMFTVNGEGYLTTRDIGVGSTRDEVIKAYGDKYYDDGYYLTYSESGDESNIADMRIQFCFENDVVTEFFIYSPSYSN
ncbi:MAG: hypothetical protein IJM18_06810 [Clostridia bacterium]|nr:hypothetical protein [Clostridia bacterium]